MQWFLLLSFDISTGGGNSENFLSEKLLFISPVEWKQFQSFLGNLCGDFSLNLPTNGFMIKLNDLSSAGLMNMPLKLLLS